MLTALINKYLRLYKIMMKQNVGRYNQPSTVQIYQIFLQLMLVLYDYCTEYMYITNNTLAANVQQSLNNLLTGLCIDYSAPH